LARLRELAAGRGGEHAAYRLANALAGQGNLDQAVETIAIVDGRAVGEKGMTPELFRLRAALCTIPAGQARQSLNYALTRRSATGTWRRNWHQCYLTAGKSTRP
jgi:hypothetical protein